MDDFIWAHGHSDWRDLLCRTTFSPPTVCARHSFGKDDAILGSIPQRMGIPRRSGPAGRWNRPGPEQKVPAGRSLDWRTNDRRDSIPISAYFDSRLLRTSAGDQ